MSEVIANKEQAKKKIDALVQQAHHIIQEAESIADDWKLSFNFEIAYGMGGRYQGDIKQRWWESDWGLDPGDQGWLPSSRSC